MKSVRRGSEYKRAAKGPATGHRFYFRAVEKGRGSPREIPQSLEESLSFISIAMGARCFPIIVSVSMADATVIAQSARRYQTVLIIGGLPFPIILPRTESTETFSFLTVLLPKTQGHFLARAHRTAASQRVDCLSGRKRKYSRVWGGLPLHFFHARSILPYLVRRGSLSGWFLVSRSSPSLLLPLVAL